MARLGSSQLIIVVQLSPGPISSGIGNYLQNSALIFSCDFEVCVVAFSAVVLSDTYRMSSSYQYKQAPQLQIFYSPSLIAQN